MLMLLQAAQQPVQVRSSELPVERCRALLVAALEGQQASFDLGQVGEVVGRHDLALHDREVESPPWVANPSAISPADTLPRKMLARPLASPMVAARSICRLKCSVVVVKVTAAWGFSASCWRRSSTVTRSALVGADATTSHGARLSHQHPSQKHAPGHVAAWSVRTSRQLGGAVS
jgi:hypothetical protein